MLGGITIPDARMTRNVLALALACALASLPVLAQDPPAPPPVEAPEQQDGPADKVELEQDALDAAGVDPAEAPLESARGLGMNAFQVFARVQLPLAIPVIIAGVRTASVEVIGSATLAAFIGAGGLGTFISVHTGIGCVGLGIGTDSWNRAQECGVFGGSFDRLMSWGGLGCGRSIDSRF